MTNTVALLVLSLSALLPLSAHAAASCHAQGNKSAACKAKPVKKSPAAKQTAAKTKTTSKATAKTGVTAKTQSVSAKSSSKAKSSAQAKASAKKTTHAQASKSKRRGKAQPAFNAEAALVPPHAASVDGEIAALRSSTVYVQDLQTSSVIFAKNANVVRPIASITKLMTAILVLDANQPMNEMLEITDDDVDELKHTTSRLVVGTQLSRGDLLHLALMSSENRAAHALARNYPGGLRAFITAMNAKARSMGMINTRFIEPTGLSSSNVSSPHDLALLLRAAAQRPLIHRYSTDSEYEVPVNNRIQTFRNTNLLVRKSDWDIKVSKTGYINEAGECLVMLVNINGREMAFVLLDSRGKYSRVADAVRVRRIIQEEVAQASLRPEG